MIIKIALIDDDPDDRELFSEALALVDPSTICLASDNINDITNEPHQQPLNAVFIDVNMPRMSGWECLRLLRSDPAYQAVPVIMYSTSNSQEDIDMAERFNSFGLLSKPTDFEHLKSVLRTITTHLKEGTFTREAFAKLAR